MIDTAGWSKELLFSTVMGHQLKGIMFHNDLANLSGFWGLHNFQKWHMCRVLGETEDHLKTQSHYILYHQKMPISEKGMQSSLIPNEAYSAKSTEVKPEYRKRMAKEMMEKWKAWEDQTIELYLAAVGYLYNNHCKDVFFFEELLEDTYEEYKYIVKCMERLNTKEYNIDEILKTEKHYKK